MHRIGRVPVILTPMKRAVRRLYAGWMAFARRLGILMSSILLGAIFLLVVPWLRLLFVRRRAVLGTGLEEASFWEKAPPVPADVESLLRQY